MLKQLMKRCVCKIWRNVLITVVARVVFDEIRTCIPFENSAVEQNIVATDTSLLLDIIFLSCLYDQVLQKGGGGCTICTNLLHS